MADVDVTPDDLILYTLTAATVTVIINVIKLRIKKEQHRSKRTILVAKSIQALPSLHQTESF
jgi:hypothetical protein